jgi:hypothetical protein
MNLKELELEEKILKSSIKGFKEEIKKQTEALQTVLKVDEAKLKKVKEDIITVKRSVMTDKNVHPMSRLVLWFKSPGKENGGYIIESGPLRDTFFDDENRYSTISIVDRLPDIFWEIGYYLDLDDEDFEMDLTEEKECIEKYDSLDSDSKRALEAIIDDIIKINTDTFDYDW